MFQGRTQSNLLAIWCLAGFASPGLLAQAPLNFISVTPCRVADTRNAAGSFGGPFMAAGEIRSFAIPNSACNIPPVAAAYSLNVTVVPREPLGFLAIWPAGETQPLVSTLNSENAEIVANAVIVSAGINGAISIYVTNDTELILDINGYFAPQSDSTGDQSTAFGAGASNAATQNTAVGFDALQFNAAGNGNMASGAQALANNTSGNNNVAMGTAAMSFNVTGSANTAAGGSALLNNLSGSDNVAVGFNALGTNTTGSHNIAVGVNAGYQVINNGNIEIGTQGLSSDQNAIRIGDPTVQTSAFMAGINDATVTGAAVLVDPSTGQLGIASSSARYKDDIRDIGEASDDLMQLRPVTFRYKRAAGDEAKPLQYGLIGEEVEKVYPELVIHGSRGEVESIAYHELPALMLNELQKQHKTIEELEARIAALEALLGMTANH